jgi:triosephosphate isomerase (TIM)
MSLPQLLLLVTVPSAVEAFHVIHSSYLSSLSQASPPFTDSNSKNPKPSSSIPPDVNTRSNSNSKYDTSINQDQYDLRAQEQLSSMGYEDSLTRRHKRRPIMAGNWKLNPTTHAEAINLLKLIASDFINHRTTSSSTTMEDVPEVIVFPPFPFLETAIHVLDGSGIRVGAQNIGTETNGAYTGEVAASMVRSLGCEYVLLGHSERRSIYKESDSVINKKVQLCLQEPNLKVILCIGETEEEYESGLLNSVVDMQIKKGLMGISGEDLSRVCVAYEPVWSIGTGKAATPEQAQAAHGVVRDTLSDMYGKDLAEKVRIQYGGSVKPENVEELMAMPDIDGALVGGASLTADSFTRIVDGGTNIVSSGVSTHPLELTARKVLATKNVLGESPVWSDRDQCLYWVSAPEEEVWAWNMIDPPYRRLMGTVLGCVALKAGEPGSIVLGGERAILEVKMTGDTNDYATGPNILRERPDQASTTRPNDGRVDRQGRLVFGMYNNYHRAGASEGENNAGLFRLNEKLEYENILDYQFRVSNCICFPADGSTMYFCDSPTRKVYAFDYPTQPGGKLCNRRLIWTVPSNLPGVPDGAQVDVDGFIWIALSGAGRVVRVDPHSGSVDMVVHLPVKSPTSCTFGGRDLDELFITTRGPDGGGLYRVKLPYRTGVRGISEPEFVVGRSMSASMDMSRSPWW